MGHPPTRPGGIGKDEKRNTTKRQTVKMKEDQKPHPLLNCAKDWAPTHPRPYLTLGVGHPSRIQKISNGRNSGCGQHKKKPTTADEKISGPCTATPGMR